LYKKRLSKVPPGFSDFIEKLREMGLNTYFELNKTFKTKRKLTNELTKSLQSTSDKKSWWLLT